MTSAYADILPWGLESSNLGEQKQSGDEDWICDFDFSDLPQLPIEADVANLPLLDDLFLLEGTDSPDSVSSFWQPADIHSAGRREENEDFDITDEDIERWKRGMDSPLFPTPARSSNSGEAGSPSDELASPVSSIDVSVENTQYHAESAGNAQIHVGSASGSCAGERMADLGVKARPDLSQKKQMRLLRNRELAFESRQRKKSYIKELESKCKMLQQEHNQLHLQICLVSSENTILKEEVSRLKRKKGCTGVAEPAALKDSLPLEFLLHLTCLSFLALLSLLGNPYLGLLVVSVHLQRFKVKAGGLVKGPVDSKACCLAVRSSGLLDTGLTCNYSAASRKQCSFSFWRRRRKLFDMTFESHHVQLKARGLCMSYAGSFMQYIGSAGDHGARNLLIRSQLIQSILVFKVGALLNYEVQGEYETLIIIY